MNRCRHHLAFFVMSLPTSLLVAQITPSTARKTTAVSRSIPSSVAIPIAAYASTSIASAPATSNASSAAAPTRPVSRTFHDPAWKLSFDYPSNWDFANTDREISTFHLDARFAPRNATLRAVAALPENPYPASTFSGAYLYFSVTPHSRVAACASQAAPRAAGRPTPAAKPTASQIAGIPFAHGHDEQKNICTTARDEIYTTFRRGACYRFDIAINTFCGGEVSGVKDISRKELDDVRSRMEAVFATVRFDPK